MNNHVLRVGVQRLLKASLEIHLALLGKTDGVVHQRVQGLGQTLKVARQGFGNVRIHADHEFKVLFFRLEGIGGDQTFHQRRQQERGFLQFKSILRDTGKVQHLVDHVEQRLCPMLQLADIVALLFGHAGL